MNIVMLHDHTYAFWYSKAKVFSILQNSSKTLLFDHYGIVEPYHFIETRMQRRPQVVFLGY